MRDFYQRGATPETMLLKHRETSGNETFDREIVAPWRKARIREASFGNRKPYSTEEVEADLAYVREKEEQQFDSAREGEAATGMYYGTMEGIVAYDWLGPDAEVIPASRYDDIRHGVDFVVVFTREDAESIILAVDATTTEDAAALDHKTERSRQDIKHGKLATLKYFDTPGKLDGQVQKRGMTSMPRVVIGANAENAKQLTEAFATVFEKGGKRGLGEHHLQHALLTEIEGQLREQLAAAVEALGKRFDVRHDPPKILEAFADWEQRLPNESEDTGLSREHIAALQEVLQQDHARLEQVDGDWGKNVEVLNETLAQIVSVRNEKGAGENPDTLIADRTVQTLSHHRRAA
ncbi:MAG: hypothetical protein AAB515_02295 [Patescibacteria group bacterium]